MGRSSLHQPLLASVTALLTPSDKKHRVHELLLKSTLTMLEVYILLLLLLLLHLFNSLFSRTTWVSRHQNGKTSLDLNEAKDDGIMGCNGIRSMDHVQTIYTLIQTDNHTNTLSLSFHRPDSVAMTLYCCSCLISKRTVLYHVAAAECSRRCNHCRGPAASFYSAMLCIRGTSHGPVAVCLSQVSVLLKQLNVGSHKQHHTIAQGL